MAVVRISVPHKGVYIPLELRFLRGVVREAMRTVSAELDKEDAELIARDVMAAYREGILDREELLEVARKATKERETENFYDRVSGFFA